MIVTEIESLNDGSLFSQYHSGALIKMFKPHHHSSQFAVLALLVRRSFMLSRSLFPGINDDRFMKYHTFVSSGGVIGLTSHRHEASYSYLTTSPSDSFGKLFTYHIVDTINSPGVVCDGNFHVILQMLIFEVSTFGISLFTMYHQFNSPHKNSFRGCA
ncbi:hypothetical protein IKI14_03780 [bacterium]|nr:hypothetical protein [bacterium]